MGSSGAHLNDLTANSPVCWQCGGLLNPEVAHVCAQPSPGFTGFPGRCIYCGTALSLSVPHTCSRPFGAHTVLELHDPAVEPLEQEVTELRARVDALEAALRAKE